MFSKSKDKEKKVTSQTQSHIVSQQTSHNLSVQTTYRSRSVSYSSNGNDVTSRSGSLLSLPNINRLAIGNGRDRNKASSYNSMFNTKTDAKAIPPAPNVNLNYQSPYRNSPVYRSYQAPKKSYALTEIRKPDSIPIKSPILTKSKNQKYTVKKTGKLYDGDNKIPTYKTSSRHRGEVLIINNIMFEDKSQKNEREGAKVDDENLKRLFKDMGLNVTVERNLKKSGMESKVESFSKSRSLKSADISIVIVMSHGTKNQSLGDTEVFGTDEKGVLVETLLENFSNDKCKNMTNKPKIFIFQCCRGDNEQFIQSDARPYKAVHSDMLIAYSTLPGFVSYRDPVHGTWYIQTICEVFSQYAHELNIEEMLKIVDDKLSKIGSSTRQTSSYESRGFKRCYFHPI